MDRGSWRILFCNEYHWSSSWGTIAISEMWLYIKNKVHNTKMQMQSNKLLWIEVCTCGAKDESCDNVMLDESIDGDSLTDDM